MWPRAAELGLVNGYEGGIFRPEAGITRAEASAIINRTLGRAPVGTGLLPEREMNTWPDNPADAWYYAHMQEATNSHAYRMSNGADSGRAGSRSPTGRPAALKLNAKALKPRFQGLFAPCVRFFRINPAPGAQTKFILSRELNFL